VGFIFCMKIAATFADGYLGKEEEIVLRASLTFALIIYKSKLCRPKSIVKYFLQNANTLIFIVKAAFPSYAALTSFGDGCTALPAAASTIAASFK
jgi:hypothetical protein